MTLEAAVTDQPPLIAHIIYHLGIGGLENGLVNLINSTPANRYRHAVICLAGHSDFADRITRDDVRLFDLEKRPGKDFGCYVRLYRLLRKLRPQIVHTRNFGTLDCQFVSAIAGVAYRVHGEHGWDMSDMHGTLTKTVLFRRISRVAIHQYTTVSRHMADWLKNVIGIPVGRVAQIYNGIDSTKFRPGTGDANSVGAAESKRSGRLVIGTVGRLDPIKDHLTLLRALDISVQRPVRGERELHLVIVGAGEMQQTLVDFVDEKQLDSFVTFVGASDEVAQHLRTFDIFVLPSLNEGISNTILEAMATGLPVLASSAGGNPELVSDGATGSLFAPGDAEGLAEQICTYADDPGLRRAHGLAGRARAIGDFGMDAMVENYLRVYDQGLANNRMLSRTTG